MATLFTDGKFQPVDASGNPYPGGKLYTYIAGTTTALATYTTPGLTVPNANPVILDSAGRASVWLGDGTYRMILKDSSDVTIWDVDNINGNASEANVLMYGSTGDGTTDDRAAIQSAIDAMWTAGGGTVVIPHPTNFYRIALSLQARSGVTVRVPNNATRIVCTGDGTGARWPIDGAWGYGHMRISNYVRCTAYAANAVARGDVSVTVTTAGDSANFAVGDVIAVESVATYVIGANTHNTWLQLNVVTGIAGGVISLRHPIDETHASVKIRQLTTDLNAFAADGTDSGYPLQAIRDFSLFGGTWETNTNAAFGSGGGAIDCVIRPHRVVSGFGPAYGNCFAYCDIACDVLDAYATPIELAFGCSGTKVRHGYVTCRDDGYSHAWMVATTESARHNDIGIVSLNCGNADPSSGVVSNYNGYGNRFDIGSLTGAALTYQVVLMATTAWAGTPNDATDNTVNIRYSKFASQLRYVYNSPNSDRNIITGNFFGTVTFAQGVSAFGEDCTIDGYYENGTIGVDTTGLNNRFLGHIGTGKAHVTDYAGLYANRYGSQSASAKDLRALSYMKSPGTYTSVAPLANSVEFAANTLTTGDIIRMRLRGVATGNNSTKTLVVTVAGSPILNLSGGAAIAASASNVGIDVDIELTVVSNSVISGQVTYTIGGTTAILDVGLTGLDVAATAYDVDVDVTVAHASDTLILRFHRMNAIRPNAELVVL